MPGEERTGPVEASIPTWRQDLENRPRGPEHGHSALSHPTRPPSRARGQPGQRLESHTEMSNASDFLTTTEGAASCCC